MMMAGRSGMVMTGRSGTVANVQPLLLKITVTRSVRSARVRCSM